MATSSFNARLDQLRALLAEDPSEEAWAALVDLLEGWEGDADLGVALDYARAHVLAWPAELRVLPESWILSGARGPDPRVALAGTLTYSGRGERPQAHHLRRFFSHHPHLPIERLEIWRAPVERVGLDAVQMPDLRRVRGRYVEQGPFLAALADNPSVTDLDHLSLEHPMGRADRGRPRAPMPSCRSLRFVRVALNSALTAAVSRETAELVHLERVTCEGEAPFWSAGPWPALRTIRLVDCGDPELYADLADAALPALEEIVLGAVALSVAEVLLESPHRDRVKVISHRS